MGGAFKVDPAVVRILRHKDDRRSAPNRTPYDLWLHHRPDFEDYQSTQNPRKRRGLSSAKYWASFIATPDGRTLFVGLYASRYKGLGDSDGPWASNPDIIHKPGTYDVYDLKLQAALADLDGKLAIDWGTAHQARSFAQYAHKHDKAVIELQKAFKEPDFPGPLHFIKPLSEIERLPQTWKEVLRNMKGIYLLTCPKTKEQYVGKADGQEGFLGRWEEYARDGHGGNVVLKNRERSDYQVSILEQAGTVFNFDDAEALWKHKLQTRQMGLNGN